MGSDVGFEINWGDGHTSNLSPIYQASSSSPLTMVLEHTYSTEGKYVVSLVAMNNVSYESLQAEAFIQRSLDGLTLEAPKGLQVLEAGLFKLSFSSIEPLNVSWDFGHGIIFRKLANTSMTYRFTSPGSFLVKAEAANLLSSVKLSTVVSVQHKIGVFRFQREVYYAEVGKALNQILLQNGTNANIEIDYKDGTKTQIAADSNNQTNAASHTFNISGVYHIVATASNLVSSMKASTLVISEQRIAGLTASVTCYGRTPYCFEKDSVEIVAKLTSGTNLNFIYSLGDGTDSNSTLAAIRYMYENQGNFTVKITAYNNISTSTVILPTIFVRELVPLEGLSITCNKSVQLSNITTCHLEISNGTGYSCNVNFGDGNTFVLQDQNFTSMILHEYKERGSFLVQFFCSNSLGTITEDFKTQVGSILGLKTTHATRAVAKEPLTFLMEMEFKGGIETCFVLDFGDGSKVGYYSDDASCGVEYDGIIFSKLPPDFSVSVDHSYTSAGLYTISWSASNELNNDTIESTVIVTKGICLFPQVEFTNLNDNINSAFQILRSERYDIRSKITVQCDEATGSKISWNIKRELSADTYEDVTQVNSEVAELILEPLSLSIGLYRVTCSFTLLGVLDTFNSTERRIEIIPSPLKAVILHGPLLRMSVRTDVFLEGSSSQDPDEPSRGINGMELTWDCIIPTDVQIATIGSSPVSSLEEVFSSNSSSSCFANTTVDIKSPSLVLPAVILNINSTFIVQLSLKKAERRTSTVAVLQIAPESTPQLTIR